MGQQTLQCIIIKDWQQRNLETEKFFQSVEEKKQEQKIFDGLQ